MSKTGFIILINESEDPDRQKIFEPEPVLCVRLGLKAEHLMTKDDEKISRLNFFFIFLIAVFIYLYTSMKYVQATGEAFAL